MPVRLGRRTASVTCRWDILLQTGDKAPVRDVALGV